MAWYSKVTDTVSKPTLVGGLLGGGTGALAGKAYEWVDSSRQKGREARQRLGNSYEQQYQDTSRIYGNMDRRDQDYISSAQDYTNKYKSNMGNAYDRFDRRSNALMSEAESQAKDARETYTNTIQPNLKNIMEDARTQAGQAMSLQDAGDPNNAVHRAVRGMYDEQAQQEGKRGLADAGVLAGLGAQAFGQQLGAAGGPMTGSQMQLLASVNQGQSAQAFANTQRRMAALRDQGIAQGFVESDRQYQRGQQAKDRYSDSVHDIEGASLRESDRGRLSRSERDGFSRQLADSNMGRNSMLYGADMGMAGMRHEAAMNSSARELGALNQRYGNQQGMLGNDAARNYADYTGKIGAITNIAATGANYAGNAFGGPGAGAAASQGVQGIGAFAAPPSQQVNLNQQSLYGPGTQRYGNAYGQQMYA